MMLQKESKWKIHLLVNKMELINPLLFLQFNYPNLINQEKKEDQEEV